MHGDALEVRSPELHRILHRPAADKDVEGNEHEEKKNYTNHSKIHEPLHVTPPSVGFYRFSLGKIAQLPSSREYINNSISKK